MFTSASWAIAFINFLEKGGGDPKLRTEGSQLADIEEGVETFMALATLAPSLQGAILGRAAAEKMEPLIRKGISSSGTLSYAQETAVKFFLLIVKKNAVRHIYGISEEIKKQINKRQGVVVVSVEYAFEPEKEFESRIVETIKNQLGTARVELSAQLNPDLIGGYRLRIGDGIIDASIRNQLRKMKTCLAAGGGN